MQLTKKEAYPPKTHPTAQLWDGTHYPQIRPPVSTCTFWCIKKQTKQNSKTYILAEKEDSVLFLIVFSRKCIAKTSFYFNITHCLQRLTKEAG